MKKSNNAEDNKLGDSNNWLLFCRDGAAEPWSAHLPLQLGGEGQGLPDLNRDGDGGQVKEGDDVKGDN